MEIEHDRNHENIHFAYFLSCSEEDHSLFALMDHHLQGKRAWLVMSDGRDAFLPALREILACIFQ